MDDSIFILTIIQIVLLLVLVFFIFQNRRQLSQLKSRINEYIDKDMDNLKKVLEISMQNDIKLYDKQKFILDVLEEDGQITQVMQSNSSNLGELNFEQAMSIPNGGDAWYDNIISGNLFNKYLNLYN